ncbi:MAG: glucose 1-dehydrogenase [Verrucomicrobia bacterium]|nr:glucose 1-dehydrogenase [Verrucomicrobiota bacterium]
MFRLDHKVALVTGAARGVGAAATRLLASQGARVAAADLRFDEVQRLAAEIGDAVKAYQVDVANVSELRAFVDGVVRDFGRIDILVNNAGICPRLPFADSTEADWEKLMSVNAKSQYFLMQAVCPVMKAQGGGRIINLASTGGRVGSVANASLYSGTKGAIVMFSKSVAREVAADGILVNCVAPGVVDTDLVRNLPPERLRALCDQIPLKRLARPDEVAALIVYLASDECSYCTGATFDINGGWVML